MGRYVKADGSLTDAYTTPARRRALPATSPPTRSRSGSPRPGTTTLNALRGSPTAARSSRSATFGSFGGRPVDANGDFMDFDGADQPAGPDVDTRGMLVCDSSGAVSRRYYVNVYPALTVHGTLGTGHPGGAPGHANPDKCKGH